MRNFSRYHKYTLGSDLRNISGKIVRLIIKANSEKDEKDKVSILEEVRVEIEELKVFAEICKNVACLK